jgi:hypothetical protein
MNQAQSQMLWSQFGAAIDMLENAIIQCPEKIWIGEFPHPYWYSVYHCLFFLDYYSTVQMQDFQPPKPFNLDELNPEGIMPDRIYTKDEMLKYLQYGRKKSFDLINGLNEKNIQQRVTNHYRDYNIFENIINNMRHIQHHAAQLNLILRQQTNGAPNWVAQTKK